MNMIFSSKTGLSHIKTGIAGFKFCNSIVHDQFVLTERMPSRMASMIPLRIMVLPAPKQIT